eukprot:12410473-Karenia_brevis.AAC.1
MTRVAQRAREEVKTQEQDKAREEEMKRKRQEAEEEMQKLKNQRLQAGLAGSPGANTGGNGSSSSGAAEQAD